MNRRITTTAVGLLLSLAAAGPAGPPKVGDAAKDFTLNTLDGTAVTLSELCKTGPVVVLQLRGWVGYQCPLCTQQIASFMGKADDFRKAGATVVLVYPGPADGLKDHASEFVSGKSLPDNFKFVVDPGLTFVDAWGLRWDKKGETAYPSTFVVDKGQTIRFAKVSHSHGDRATPKQVLAAIPAKP